jgi:hypothetical protein
MSRVNPVMKSAKPHMCYLQYTGDGSPDPREFAREPGATYRQYDRGPHQVKVTANVIIVENISLFATPTLSSSCSVAIVGGYRNLLVTKRGGSWLLASWGTITLKAGVRAIARIRVLLMVIPRYYETFAGFAR